MNRFLIKLIIFSIFPLLSLYGVFLLENGTADPFYRRVIGGKKKSLVIGTSKAAQGIVPSVLNERLELEGENELFNFGFTVLHSPFGESYFGAIQKKICNNTTDGIFIVSVDPWSLASFKSDPNDRSLMQENHLFIGKLSSFSLRMNFEYLFNYYNDSFYEILASHFKNNSLTLKDDGWLMATPNLKEEWIKSIYESKLKEYKSRADSTKFSEYRYNSFLELLHYLKKKGSVYVIVMPVDKKIYEIEMNLFPDMVNQVNQFCKSNGIPFRDFNNSDTTFKFNDGVHLHYKSSKDFSDDLANWILELEKKN